MIFNDFQVLFEYFSELFGRKRTIRAGFHAASRRSGGRSGRGVPVSLQLHLLAVLAVLHRRRRAGHVAAPRADAELRRNALRTAGVPKALPRRGQAQGPRPYSPYRP